MKPIRAFFMSLLCVPAAVAAEGLRFLEPPAARRFADGALEWSASVSCAEPALLLGARIVFSLQAGLEEGEADAAVPAPLALSPAGCEDDRLPVRRTFLAGAPAVLRAALSTGADSVTDIHSLLTGDAGSLLALRRFCARPRNGEPEWIEVRNVAAVPVSLAKARLEGRALSGAAKLDPGESLTALAAADTAEMRLWQPGARAFPLSSWPGLRNSGDTLRLSVDVPVRNGAVASLILDSVIYGVAAVPREACASVPAEESAAAAHGFALEMPPGRWKRRAGPWTVTVTAPAAGAYDLRVYDLDGLALCALAHGASGPRTFALSRATCGRLTASATAVLLHLQPRGAPPARRLLRIAP